MFSSPQPLRLLAVCLALSQVSNAWSLNLRAAQEEKEVARGLLDNPLSAVGSVLLGTAAASTTSTSTSAPATTTSKSSKTTTSDSASATTTTSPKATATSTTPPAAASSTTTQDKDTTSTTPTSASTTTAAAQSSTTDKNALTTTTAPTAAASSSSSAVEEVTVVTTVSGKATSYTTTPSSTATSSGSSKSSSAATLSQDSTSKSGMSTKTRNTVIGVVVGVGGAIVLLGLVVVAWRIWGRKKNTDESDGLMGFRSGVDSSGHEKSGSISGNNSSRNPFQSTLESYHNPAHGVNASSNF